MWIDSSDWNLLQGPVLRCLKVDSVWDLSWQQEWPIVEAQQHNMFTVQCLPQHWQLICTAHMPNMKTEGTHFLVYFETGRGAAVVTTPQAAQAECLRIQHPTSSSHFVRLAVAPCVSRGPATQILTCRVCC